ncbi:hypothetical protein ACFLV0_05345 [Chloroflexota bacterium]
MKPKKKQYLTLDRAGVLKILKYLEEGKTPLVIEKSGITSRRSAERVQTAHKGFTAGMPFSEIASRAEWGEEHVRKVNEWWLYYLRNKSKFGKDKHIRELMNLVKKLKKFTINPNMHKQRYAAPSTWD